MDGDSASLSSFMATRWVKSLKCKSRALDDVVLPYQTNPKHRLVPASSSNCRKSVQTLNEVIETANKKLRKTPKPPAPPAPPLPPKRRHISRKPVPTNRVRPNTDSRALNPLFPALIELHENHPSRNVVEIIFHTSWESKALSGKVEMVFKIQNLSRTMTRFEEYREMVKSHAVSGVAMDGGCEDQARCVADGNEVMRFHCLGPTSGCLGSEAGGGGAWALRGRKGAICMFSESGGAHESAGGGRGRRAMLVCRVIAGRVRKKTGFERIVFDSVMGDNGELVLFDSRAVLPCFVIIYRL
ncbi:hypothetical protein U1Q18_021379 [Sarracenia purpurea var. burkii]